jgi:uncharacterized protein (DUF1501 family)
LADWPGLGSGHLFEDRDLAPTLDVRALLKGALADHLRISLASLNVVFPGSTQVTPVQGLCAA